MENSRRRKVSESGEDEGDLFRSLNGKANQLVKCDVGITVSVVLSLLSNVFLFLFLSFLIISS